jgi:hypothetical protein
VLREMELVPVDAKDRPTTDIKILSVSVFGDPYAEVSAPRCGNVWPHVHAGMCTCVCGAVCARVYVFSEKCR